MEQDFEQSGQEQPHTRYILSFNTLGKIGKCFSSITDKAQELLEGEDHESFMEEINAATAPGAAKVYEDILALVNKCVRLIDTLGNYPQYGFADGQEAADGTGTAE